MSSVPSSAAITDARVRSGETQRNSGVVRLSTVKTVPRARSTLKVDPAEFRWTHEKIQRHFTRGRRLEDVMTDSQLCLIEIDHDEEQ